MRFWLGVTPKAPKGHYHLPHGKSISRKTQKVIAVNFPIEEDPVKCEDSKILYLTGVFAEADYTNLNKRRYTKEILVKEAQRYHEIFILPGKAFGELTHPNYTSASFCCVETLAISHQIMALWWRGNHLHGLVRLLDTASGRQAAALLAAGRQLGASMRSWTSLVPDESSGALVVQDDMHLITFDLTTRPASGAYMQLVPRQQQLALQSRIPDAVLNAQCSNSPEV